ncbi:MAG TPA: TetR/AcrR family transcriptional regulator [Burkholderiales bacterium]|nr:TetR/AcrR family transcriptional regulator [Burkholderiales bacterium]
MPRGSAKADTSQRILDIAERLVQTRGFNGFSYADIASALTLTKASLHYHFPTKAGLGTRLIERYEAGFLKALEEIDRTTPDARDKLRRYAKIYADVLRNNRMCLCGMLAAEYATLPKSMKEEMRHFFDENERWLSRVLEEGRASGSLRFTGSALDVARALVGSLEGAMMIARSYGEVARLETVADRLIAEL